jgi:hypothetical protein
MLTRNLTTLPVHVGVSFPLSPAAISPETSLADLKAIKAFWTMGAREQGYPEKIYNVTNCLGKEVITHPDGRVHKIWSGGNVYALAREYVDRYVPTRGTNLVVYLLAVYFGELDHKHKNPVDQIVLSDKMLKVAYLHWNLVGEDVTEWDDNYLIPGKWLDVFLTAEAEANEISARAALGQMENERQQLLAEMLAGHEV